MSSLLFRGLSLIGLIFVGLVTTAHAQHGDRAFRRQVREATARGKGFLIQSLGRKRKRSNSQFERAYPMGYRSLVAYALLEAGLGPETPEMEKLFDDLNKLKFAQTYSASLYTMALDARVRARELSSSIAEREKKHYPRRERKRLESSVLWLLEAKWPDKGTWGYERWQNEKRGKWDDYSNTQFAVLALAVGAQRGVDIPASVYEEVLITFAENGWASGAIEDLSIQGPGWWQDVAEIGGDGSTGVARPISEKSDGYRLRGAPQVWGYRPGYGGQGSPGQYSMIAAATSSLMVARQGLGAKLGPSARWDVDRWIAGGVISLHHGFKKLFPVPGDSIHRNYYYTLYSLEKALDLGGIVLLGDIDWYREQAVLLMNDQLPGGAWGQPQNGPEYQDVSTAFALLFLKRATRHLRVEKMGDILTGSGGRSGVEEGRVYVPSLRGTVEIEEAFESLADSRTQRDLQLVREILDSIPPDQIIDLLPHLAKVRNGSRDQTDRLAETTISTVTGLPGRSELNDIVQWRETTLGIRQRGRDRDENAVSWLVELLESRETTDRMRIEILRTLARISSVAAVPALIRLVASGPSGVSRRSHEVLSDLTAHRFALPQSPTAEQRTSAAERWSGFWETNGTRITHLEEFEKLRRELDSCLVPSERERLIDEIVALGPAVLARVDAILGQDRFAFDWVLVRERLTGERVGI